MSKVNILERSTSVGQGEDRDLFVGTTVPKDIQQCIKRLPQLGKIHFRKMLQVLVAAMEGDAYDTSSMRDMVTDQLSEQDIHTVYTGLLSLLHLALRLPQTSLKQQTFKDDLAELKVPEEFMDDLASVVFGSRRPNIERKIVEGRPRLPSLEQLKWRVDVAISTSVLNRVLEPSILMEMTLSDKKVHKFEVPVSKFSQLRYNVAYVLKEMEQLEKRSILKIQD